MKTVVLALALCAAFVAVPIASAAEAPPVPEIPGEPSAGVCIPLIGCFRVCTPDGTCFY